MKKEAQRLGYLEGWVSTVLNTILFAVKIWVGILTGSVAMIADAWHTLSDSFTSIIVIFSFWVSGKPEDKEHPFGHGRAEQIAAIVIGVLLGIVGFNFLKDSILVLRNYKSAHFSMFSIIVFCVSVVLKEALAQFSMWAGRKIKAQSLIADGWHHRSDAIASLLIVIGALLGKYFWWIDGVLGIAVSLLIVYAAFDIIRDATAVFMGENVEGELRETILRVIRETTPDVIDMHHIHMHRYGDHREVTMHLSMPDTYSLIQAHELSSQIEIKLRSETGIEPTIHFEPARDFEKARTGTSFRFNLKN